MEIVANPFDSTYLERRVGWLRFATGDGTAALEAALVRARAEAYEVLFVRVSDDDPANRVLAAAGHAPVDTLVTSALGAERRVPPPAAAIDFAHHAKLEHPADVARVRAITEQTFTSSHLHADPRIERARIQALYAAWAVNDVTGRAQRTFVAREGGELVGFLAMLDTGARVAVDLIAVAAAHQAKGIGGGLLASMIAWLGDREVLATVGTQVQNPALALYRRCGFLPARRDLTYHLWLA